MNRRDFLKSVMVGAAGVSVPLMATDDIQLRIQELHEYWDRVLVWGRELTEREREQVGMHLVKEAISMFPDSEGTYCIVDPVSYAGRTVAVVRYPRNKHSGSSE